MADRINEDIRFYLPADPYYYQVDNLPLEDLVMNDRILQEQIDELAAGGESSNRIGRSGFDDLHPSVDPALPGRVAVRPGSFIGRVQRTSGAGLPGMTGQTGNNGIWEMNEPPTKLGYWYNVSNKPRPAEPWKAVGRTALFQFRGGNIMLDSFDFDDFGMMGDGSNRTAPLARIDLVGITTVNGAMDDPYMDGNGTPSNVVLGDGYPQLAVIKGAGMIDGNADIREIAVGKRYITVGTSQERLNNYGRDLEGNIVPNPAFGTIPSPDDAINICMTRDDIDDAMLDFAERNKNETFFLPIAYVYVPQSHVQGNPIPSSYVRDIRPFFRTAELTLAERQAVANAIQPSLENPLVTVRHALNLIEPVNDALQLQLDNLITTLQNTTVAQYGTPNDTGGSTRTIRSSRFSGWLTYDAHSYGAPATTTHVWLQAWGDTNRDWASGYMAARRYGSSGSLTNWLRSFGSDVRNVADRNTGSMLCPVDEYGRFQIYASGWDANFWVGMSGWVTQEPLMPA